MTTRYGGSSISPGGKLITAYGAYLIRNRKRIQRPASLIPMPFSIDTIKMALPATTGLGTYFRHLFFAGFWIEFTRPARSELMSTIMAIFGCH